MLCVSIRYFFWFHTLARLANVRHQQLTVPFCRGTEQEKADNKIEQALMAMGTQHTARNSSKDEQDWVSVVLNEFSLRLSCRWRSKSQNEGR